MPRAFRSTNQLHFVEALIALRRDIVRRCGFEIQTAKECRILSSELEEFDRRFPLAVSTIRRFFGLIPNGSEFSITTLNALARYADKPDFHFYLDTVHADHFDVKTSAWDVAIPAAHIALPDSLSALIELVESVPYARPKMPLIARIAQGVEALYEAEDAPEHVWRKLNRSTRGRSLTIEGFPPLDTLAGTGRAMLEDYLSCSSLERDRIFATTLLATGALFRGDKRTAAKVAARIPMESESLHPVVRGRCMGLRLVLHETTAEPHSYNALTEEVRTAVALAGPDGEHTLVQPLCRMGVLCCSEPLHNGLLEAVEQLERRPELAVEAAPYLGALRLEWAWLAFCTGKGDAAWHVLKDLSAECFPFFERKTSELYLHTLAAAIAPQDSVRNHHAEQEEAVAEQLNYPWLHARLKERVAACA
jgi:hypothetical protein